MNQPMFSMQRSLIQLCRYSPLFGTGAALSPTSRSAAGTRDEMRTAGLLLPANDDAMLPLMRVNRHDTLPLGALLVA